MYKYIAIERGGDKGDDSFPEDFLQELARFNYQSLPTL